MIEPKLRFKMTNTALAGVAQWLSAVCLTLSRLPKSPREKSSVVQQYLQIPSVSFPRGVNVLLLINL